MSCNNILQNREDCQIWSHRICEYYKVTLIKVNIVRSIEENAIGEYVPWEACINITNKGMRISTITHETCHHIQYERSGHRVVRWHTVSFFRLLIDAHLFILREYGVLVPLNKHPIDGRLSMMRALLQKPVFPPK